jgi:hypothetical protein
LSTSDATWITLGANLEGKKLIISKYGKYGKAIRENAGNLHKMKHALWATYICRVSTDDNPHGLCPDDESS